MRSIDSDLWSKSSHLGCSERITNCPSALIAQWHHALLWDPGPLTTLCDHAHQSSKLEFGRLGPARNATRAAVILRMTNLGCETR